MIICDVRICTCVSSFVCVGVRVCVGVGVRACGCVCVGVCVHVCVCDRLSYPSDARGRHFVLLEDAVVVILDVVCAVVPVARYHTRAPYTFLLEVALHPVSFLVCTGNSIVANGCRTVLHVVKSKW